MLSEGQVHRTHLFWERSVPTKERSKERTSRGERLERDSERLTPSKVLLFSGGIRGREDGGDFGKETDGRRARHRHF